MNTTTNAILRTGLLSAVAGLALMSAAFADTTPLQTFAITPASTTELNQGFTFTTFVPGTGGIPAGAILDSATLTLGGNGFFYGSLSNTAAQAHTFTANANTHIFLTGPDAGTSLDGNAAVTKTYTNLASGSSADFGTVGSPLTASIGSINNTYTSASPDFGLFTGAGPLAFNINTASGFGLSAGGGNGSFGVTTKADANATLQYTYHTNTTTVPEPGAWASMSIGAMGLMFLGFKARKKNLQF